MGLEAMCEVRFRSRTVSGKARLESKELLFRGGDLRLTIPIADMISLAARNGRLEVSFGDGRASFALGSAAEKWARTIREPRSLMDKLGITPGSVVAAIALDDEDVLRQVRERAGQVSLGRARRGSDTVLIGISSKADLDRLGPLKGSLKSNGAIWAVWVKGRKTLTENDVRAAALAAGLVDVKVASVSDSLSGLRLVIPLAAR
jgi:hypothetical protein